MWGHSKWPNESCRWQQIRPGVRYCPACKTWELTTRGNVIPFPFLSANDLDAIAPLRETPRPVVVNGNDFARGFR